MTVWIIIDPYTEGAAAVTAVYTTKEAAEPQARRMGYDPELDVHEYSVNE